VNLPLQLSHAVTLVAVAALWRPESALLVELVYFWALSASLQAVLTPDLGQAFPDLLFFTYFVTHSGAITAACLLVFGSRRAPRPKTVWRIYAITFAFACLAAVGTVLTGGNYMFLRDKPARGSLLDLMGPWPVYILVAALLALSMFLARRVGTAHLGARPTEHDPTSGRLTVARPTGRRHALEERHPARLGEPAGLLLPTAAARVPPDPPHTRARDELRSSRTRDGGYRFSGGSERLPGARRRAR
jgi:hypothetical protein